MSPPRATAKPDTDLPTVISRMQRGGQGLVVVVDSRSAPIGIVTERDVLGRVATVGRVDPAIRADDVLSTNFLTIPPQTPVSQAAKTMMTEKTRLLVTRKNRVLKGVLTSTNFLRSFQAHAKDILMEDAITRKVRTVGASETMKDAIRAMHQKRVGSLIVTDELGKPFGIITESDILRALKKKGTEPLNADRLEFIASRPLVTAPYGTTAKEAISIMRAHKIKRLPLMKGEELAGIVTARDLVRAYALRVRVLMRPNPRRARRRRGRVRPALAQSA